MDETAPTVVVVGASAGGVEALTTLAAGLPKDLDAAVCIVLHLSPDTKSRLAAIISRAGPLPTVQARGGERLVSGLIYVAPPDHHLIVSGPASARRARTSRERSAAVDRRALPQCRSLVCAPNGRGRPLGHARRRRRRRERRRSETRCSSE